MSRLPSSKLVIGAAVGVSVVGAAYLFFKPKKPVLMGLNYDLLTPEEINSAVDNAKKSTDKTSALSSLEKHVLAFGKLKAGGVYFDISTTASALKKLDEPHSTIIGTGVAVGSELQAGACPFLTTKLNVPKALHLGTSRVWNQNGSFNENRWNDILSKINLDNEFITMSAWNNAVDEFAKNDPEEPLTNRQVGKGFIHSKAVQFSTAKREAKETFKLFGMYKNGDFCIHTSLLKLFFEDTPAAIKALDELKKIQQVKMANQNYASDTWLSRATGFDMLAGR